MTITLSLSLNGSLSFFLLWSQAGFYAHAYISVCADFSSLDVLNEFTLL